MMGVLQHNVILIPRRGLSKELIRRTGWNLREEERLFLYSEECPPYHQSVIMNIIIWNCRGALKSSFQSHVRDLVDMHDPAIFVVMETHIGGDKAKEISDRLPFQRAIHTDTTGFARGLWLLWDPDRVEISNLASTKQEIHVLVKVTRALHAKWG
ncbi:uncharacterized protein LOC115965492 [Quercus lobata]|uniref:uncharacterized protein LOC115965492 n=1 Tax=Quercus lobata TaxID=97700 RepID=UPI001245F0EF|nr:uncharacterized protein LOC115965492 [Quercus lobata]